MSQSNPAIVSGSAVAVGRHAALITGLSGSGKSSLALEMISRGADLVSDDKIVAQRVNQRVELSAPKAIAGMIEARGIGILRMRHHPKAQLSVIVDMDAQETERLPERKRSLMDVEFPLILGRGKSGLPAALMVMLTNID